MSQDPNARQNAITEAQRLVARNAVFLDTETTGVGKTDQVIEIAIVGLDGASVFESLVRPTIPIPIGATNVHGIRDADVRSAPSFNEAFEEKIANAIGDRPIVTYNLDFDLRMILQSLAIHRVVIEPHPDYWACAMKLYARFASHWNPAKRSYRWWKLGEAATACKLKMPTKLHRAIADAELTRQLVRHMAEQRA